MSNIYMRSIGAALLGAGMLAGLPSSSHATTPITPLVQSVQYYYGPGPGYYGRPRFYGRPGYYGPRFYGPRYYGGPRFYGRPGYSGRGYYGGRRWR